MSHHHAHHHKHHRQADVVLRASSEHFSTMSIISHTKVKLWKAMLVSLFCVGFFAAITFMTGIGVGQIISAAPAPKTNLALLSKIVSSSYASQDEGWDKALDSDLSSSSAMVWNSQGSEAPYVVLKLPNLGSRVSGLSLSLDPSNPRYQTCGVKAFELLGSRDGNSYTSLVAGVTANMIGIQAFPISQPQDVQYVKLLMKSNWGDANYTCVREVGVF